jgi:hypothetical protein
VGGPFGEWSYKSLGCLATESWMQALWQFCDSHELAITDTWPQLQRTWTSDRYLMDIFVTFGYSGKKLVRLNECRMWQKAIMVADITKANGRTITHNSWNGERDNQRCNDFLWPRRLQTTLGYNHWVIWRAALSECLLTGNSVNNRQLRLPLGDWTKKVSSDWTWFYSP